MLPEVKIAYANVCGVGSSTVLQILNLGRSDCDGPFCSLLNEDEQSAKLEAQLLADEQPVSREGDGDCGGACTI